MNRPSPIGYRAAAGGKSRDAALADVRQYFADDATLNQLKAENRILWQYCNAMGEVTEAANPNGSLWNIAGICNERRNVAGLMPHPERACEPLLGCADGCLIFESFIFALQATIAATAA